MHRFYCGMFAALAVTVSVFASVGETEPELEQRYGKVVSRNPELTIEQQRRFAIGEVLVFKPGDWYVSALLIKGRCERIFYGKAGEWTDTQFSHLLDVNGPLSAWTADRSPYPKSSRHWTRKDGSVAYWRLGEGFTVSTPAYEQTLAAIKAAAKAEASKMPPF